MLEAQRALEVAARGLQQASAAGEDRKRPGLAERVRALLPRREHPGVVFVELADGDQRLEKVAQLQAHSRLEQEVVA